MALKIDILANTRQLQQEMKKAGASVEDITDALDDVTKQGEKGTEKLESSFKELSRQAKKTEADVKDVGDKGFKKATGAGAEFKDETLSNLSEVTSSFDGSMESIGELVQGTLGGVAANIPGIGLAAGAVAVGVGGITARFTELGEESKRIKGDIINDALEIGDALDKEAVDARVRDILGTENTMKQAQLLAEILEINVGQAALALAGDFDSAGVSLQTVRDGLEAAGGDVNFDVWNDLKNTVEATTGALTAAEDAARAQEIATGRTTQAQTKAQKELQAEVARTRAIMQQPIVFSADTTRVDNAWRNLQARANRGITVAFNNTGRNLMG